jgi:hypothetical protein
VTATLDLDTLRLRVTGSGWPARDRVTISLSEGSDVGDGEEIGESTTNRQGRFTTVITLTVAPPETAVVVVIDAEDNRAVAPIRQTP